MDTSNRKILLIGLLVVIAGVGSYGAAASIGVIDDPTGIFSDDGGNGEEKSIYDAIPERSNTVVLADPIGFAEDPVTIEVGNYVATEELELNKTYQQFLNDSYEDFNENATQSLSDGNISADVEVRDFGRVVLFGDFNESELDSVTGSQDSGFTPSGQPNFTEQYAGVLLEFETNETELDEFYNVARNDSSRLENVSFTKRTYNNHIVYTVNTVEDGENISLSLGVLSFQDNVHVFGKTQTVEDSIDSYEGDNPRVSDEILPSRGENTYFSFGSSNLNATVGESNSNITNATVESAVFSYSTDNDDTIIVSGAVTFQNFSNAIEYQQEANNNLLNASDNLSFAENINVSLDGETVRFEYNATTEEIKTAINDTVSALENNPLFGGGTDSSFETPEAQVRVTERDGNITLRVVESGEYTELYMRQDGEELKDSFGRVGFRGETYTVSPDEYNVNGSEIEVVGVKIEGRFEEGEPEEVQEVIRTIDPQADLPEPNPENTSVSFVTEESENGNGFNVTTLLQTEVGSDYYVVKTEERGVAEFETQLFGISRPEGVPKNVSQTSVVDSDENGGLIYEGGDEVVVSNAEEGVSIEVYAEDDSDEVLIETYKVSSDNVTQFGATR